MWELLSVKEHAGIELSGSLAMMPASSVSALVFAAPHAAYFAVGKLQRDQVTEYAARKGVTVEEAESVVVAESVTSAEAVPENLPVEEPVELEDTVTE